jgi:hypothetical protein
MSYANTTAPNAQEYTYLPSVGFRQVAAKVRGVYRNLQGRTITKGDLATLWKLSAGGFSTYYRAAADFGLLDIDGDNVTLTADGYELCLLEVDSHAWLQVARRCVDKSAACRAMFDRFTIDATEHDIRLDLGLRNLKAEPINRFVAVFKGCVDIKRKADGPAADTPITVGQGPTPNDVARLDTPPVDTVPVPEPATFRARVILVLTELGLYDQHPPE